MTTSTADRGLEAYLVGARTRVDRVLAEWGERVSAAVELRHGSTLALKDLQQWAQAHLAPYKIPRALRTLDTLPRNAMGKVVKPEVAALFSR